MSCEGQTPKWLCARPTTLPCKKIIVTKTPKRVAKDISVLGEDGFLEEENKTPKSESQNLEAIRPTTIISTRTTTIIGAWNVRTMYETGKAAQKAAEMRSCKLTIHGISEPRWTGWGQKRLISGEIVIFSGHEKDDAPHTLGVAMMLSRAAQGALIGWEALWT